MLKKILALAVLVTGTACFAAPGVRIDISGVSEKIILKPGKASKDLKVINSGLEKGESKYCIKAYSDTKLSDKWQKFSFSFTPEKGGVIKIHFRGAYHKPEGAKENTAIWVAYDDITVTGTEAENCDFEFVNQENMFDGWGGNAANMVTGAEDAKSGKNYVIAWHNNPVYQTLEMKKGQEVTITFFAKASEGPVKKKSDIENI